MQLPGDAPSACRVGIPHSEDGGEIPGQLSPPEQSAGMTATKGTPGPSPLRVISSGNRSHLLPVRTHQHHGSLCHLVLGSSRGLTLRTGRACAPPCAQESWAASREVPLSWRLHADTGDFGTWGAASVQHGTECTPTHRRGKPHVLSEPQVPLSRDPNQTHV